MLLRWEWKLQTASTSSVTGSECLCRKRRREAYLLLKEMLTQTFIFIPQRLFHRNPYAYIGCHISIFSLAILFILWAFHLGPSPFFCTSPDPCTCKGGGYEIYYNYCGLVQDLTKLDPIRNATTHTNLMTKILAMKTTAKSSFHVEEAFGGRCVASSDFHTCSFARPHTQGVSCAVWATSSWDLLHS